MNQHGGHRHAAGNRRRLAIVLGLVLAYMAAEFIGGLLANSLALMADAGHMLSDAAALGLSLFAAALAARPRTSKHTYGFHRAEILAALANASALIAIAIVIFIEAYRRFAEPPAVRGGLMLAIAAGGLAVNAIGLWVLQPARAGSLNVRGAWLHVLADLLGSIAAVAAGASIWALDWRWVDPAASILIGLLVLYSSWGLLKDSINVLMEGAPEHLDTVRIEKAIASTEGVRDVHDLHVWTISSGLEALSAHVVVEETPSHEELLGKVRAVLSERFGIEHVTLQIESADFDESDPPF